MFFYAQLNDDNICIGVCQLSGEVNASNLISIQEYDEGLVGKKYTEGEFIDVPKLELKIQPSTVDISEQVMAIIEAVIDVSERLERWEEKL